MQLIERAGESFGHRVAWDKTGGVCDGNKFAACGLPTIDSLGVLGGNTHSPMEYMHPDSLVSRAKLSYQILVALADGGLEKIKECAHAEQSC